MCHRNRRHLLAAAIAALVPGAANALHVSADGIGQVLIYPYYTVEDGQATLISAVNNTERVKAVKVRIREGANGKSVGDFNVYLSPFDTWTAAFVSHGTTGPGRLITTDLSCTVPLDVNRDFVNYAYTGANRDHPTSQIASMSSLERTREGFVELIDMGSVQSGEGATQLAEELSANVMTGIPGNCTAGLNAWLPPSGAWAINGQASIDLPQGGLFGAGAIIDVAAGTMLSYEATALSRFYSNAAAPGALHCSPGYDCPDLADADNGNGQVVVDLPPNETHDAVQEAFPAGGTLPNAVTLALMRFGILNEFNTEPGLSGATEWVVTFPTKWSYTDTNNLAEVTLPFTDPFRDNGASCDEVKVQYFSREAEVAGEPPPTIPPCTPPPEPPPNIPKFCRATNVLTFNQQHVQRQEAPSTVLRSTHGANINALQALTGGQYNSGHVRVCFDDPLTVEADNFLSVAGERTYQGLPMIGFGVMRGINTNAEPGVLAAYAGATRHRSFVRRSEPPAPASNER